jgi:hypothetical protein
MILSAICDRANARIISAETTRQEMAESGQMADIQRSDLTLLGYHACLRQVIEKRVASVARDRRLHD